MAAGARARLGLLGARLTGTCDLSVMSRARAVSHVAPVPDCPDMAPLHGAAVRPFALCLGCRVAKSVASTQSRPVVGPLRRPACATLGDDIMEAMRAGRLRSKCPDLVGSGTTGLTAVDRDYSRMTVWYGHAGGTRMRRTAIARGLIFWTLTT